MTRVASSWHVLNESDLVMVFVHGIFSDSRSCWLHENAASPVYWPDIVKDDPRLQSPSIFLGGYTTALNAGAFSIKHAARMVCEALKRQDRAQHPPPIAKPRIVFVCHSTGGIVVRYMLDRYDEEFENKTIGLLLLASPSYGSVLANKLRLLAKFYNQQLGLQLQWGGESLQELDGRFKDLVNRRRTTLFGMEAYEHYFVLRRRFNLLHWILPPRRRVVDPLSAGRYFGDPKLLENTDHFTIVKPDGPSHPSHEFLVTFMSDFLGFANAQVAAAHNGERIHQGIYESATRLQAEGRELGNDGLQLTSLHRTVTVRRPDVTFQCHDHLVNISKARQYEVKRVIVADTPADFTDLQAKAEVAIEGRTLPARVMGASTKDSRAFRFTISLGGEGVAPGAKFELIWSCRYPASVPRSHEYWVFPCFQKEPLNQIVSVVQFLEPPQDTAAFRLVRDGNPERVPLKGPEVVTAATGTQVYRYWIECLDTNDSYVIAWQLS